MFPVLGLLPSPYHWGILLSCSDTFPPQDCLLPSSPQCNHLVTSFQIQLEIIVLK